MTGAERAGGVAEAIEYLPDRHKALSSNPSHDFQKNMDPILKKNQRRSMSEANPDSD
jgi:hypothetical protein